MHKAIAVIQFKIEGQLIEKHPEWKMDGRRLFEHINYEKGTVEIDGKEYEMSSCNFPTIDPKYPNRLSEEETILMPETAPLFQSLRKAA